MATDWTETIETRNELNSSSPLVFDSSIQIYCYSYPINKTVRVVGCVVRHEEDAGIREIFEYADYRMRNNGNEEDFRDAIDRFAIDELGLEYSPEGDDLYREIRGGRLLR